MKRHNGQKMVRRNKKRRHENENASDGARKKKNVFEKNHFFNCGETINLGRWRILDNSNLYFEKKWTMRNIRLREKEKERVYV